VVEPAFGATSAGFAFLAGPDLSRGLRLDLGGTPTGGFALKTARGEVLWEDPWAPWEPYNAYILEGVLEGTRIRGQMLLADRRSLVSQSPWVDVPASDLVRSGVCAVFTAGSRARFWGVEADDTPLSPLTDDAPNKRRLAQGTSGEWRVDGGNWMWTTAAKERLRQYAHVERAWAFRPTAVSPDGVWQVRARVLPGAGGAGMVVKSGGDRETGLLLWLGGTWGKGCFMVYRLPLTALWASPEDKWHYDEELLLQAEVRGDQVVARLLAADGTTVLAESPPIQLTPDEAQREGGLAFHTWKGSAEFWAFAGATAGGPAPAEASRRLPFAWAGAATSVEWTDIAGSLGSWRCRVTVPDGVSAGLLLQAAEGLDQGFLAWLEPGRFALLDLSLPDQPRWEDSPCAWEAGRAYVLEGKVATDRVSVRLLSADGQTVVSESPAVYVSDRNNTRQGRLGFATRGAGAAFSEPSLTPE
jgi:hypothetical protein